MKRITIFLILFLFTPTFVFATSGACSGHGGVSCSAGPDKDGSVICMDGWKKSSVQYSTMKMCVGYFQPAAPSTPKFKENQQIKPMLPEDLKPTIPVISTTSSKFVTQENANASTNNAIQKKGFWSNLLAKFF